jgi:hypothetical protein
MAFPAGRGEATPIEVIVRIPNLDSGEDLQISPVVVASHKLSLRHPAGPSPGATR